jgi:short-subunit dehydrogenase
VKILNIGSGDIWRGMEKELRKKGHSTVSVDKDTCDVRNYRELEQTISANSNADWIIYTAGVSHVHKIKGNNLADVKEEMEVNYLGFYNTVKYATEKGIKNFIVIISVAGLYGKPNHSGYSASKMALRSLIESLAMEGYNAYGISPGRVDTVMRERDYPGEDVRTRLSCKQVADVVFEIFTGRHESGDNVIIRKRGFRVLRRRDRNSVWKKYLNIQFDRG